MSPITAELGSLGFAVLQCRSKSYLQANFTIRNSAFLGHANKKPTPVKFHLIENAKNIIFHWK